MKTRTLLLLAALAAANGSRAAESQSIDLGNGTTIEVRDGKVSVHSSAENKGGSVSQSTSSHTDAGGNTVTSVTTDRDGQRVTRTVTATKDGKVTVSDPAQPGPAPASAAPAPGGWLGVHTVPVTDVLRSQLDLPDGQGIVVEFVAAGGPAAKAGLAQNDILLAANEKPIPSVESFREQLRTMHSGEALSLRYLRKGKEATASATLGQRPADTPPGDAVTNEAERVIKAWALEDKAGSGRRSVVIEDNGKIRIIEGDGSAPDAFELLLNDPKVPEEMKAQLRKTREHLRKAQPAPAPAPEKGN